MKLSRQAEAKLMEMNICSAYVLEGDMVLDQVDSKTKWVFLLFKIDLASQLIRYHYHERHQTGGRPHSAVNNTPPRLDRTDC